MKKKIIETRTITKEEAAACGSEEVQFIGTVQPHGFVLIVDKKSHKIVQYSENFLSLLNSQLASPLSKESSVLGTFLSDWVRFSKEELAETATSKATQVSSFKEGGIISPEKWECLAVKVGDFFSLDFIPSCQEDDSLSILNVIDKMVSKVKESKTLVELYETITEQFQKYTGYDRVMLYKFHPDWSGEVIAESVSERADIKYLGLRFPAEDIPTKARELYLKASLRIMADVDADPVSLIPEHLPNGERLNQGQSTLRGMSPIHVQYLKNMKVKASLSIGLVFKGELWGLLAFHHNTPKIPPQHLVSQMKSSCELFAELIVSYLRPTVDLEKLKFEVHCQHYTENLFKSLRLSRSSLENLRICLQELREVIKKEYVGVIFKDKLYVAAGYAVDFDKAFLKNVESLLDGNDSFESASLLDPRSPTVLSSNVPLAGFIARRGDNLKELVVFFAAGEVAKEVQWGGMPHTVNIVDKNGENVLEPRNSFTQWKEKVRGSATQWTKSDRELLKTFQASLEGCILFNESEEIKLKLHKTSYHDNLTGLANRLYLKEYVESLSVESTHKTWISVFFLDLDNFKKINDYVGHHAGDFVLIETAKRLQSCVRSEDLVVRLGGDEFVIIVKHGAGDLSHKKLNAEYVAEKIIEVLSAPVILDGKSMFATPSIGVLICSPQELSLSEILRRSDIAMYYAKNAGKNRIHFFDEKDQEKVKFEGWLEDELRKSIKNKLFQVVFQPQFNGSGALKGAEALVRWELPEIGYVSPEQFIPIAEKNNLINQLGELIFEVSCKEFSSWTEKKLVNQNFSLSINISASQILSENFQRKVEGLVKRYSLSPQNICLEITESIFMENFDEATVVLNNLREKGFLISLDDFGTGYSSLSYLLKLPIDQVKIDRSFVKNMQKNSESLTIIEGIITLCNKMNFTLVAEGVETEVQYSLLKKYGCDLFQGFYLGRPVLAESFKFEDLLTK